MSRHFLAALTIVALLGVIQAQTPPRATPQSIDPPRGAATLAGIVKDPDGAPVRRATVTITGDMRLERMTIADDDGAFAFADLPGGRFTVTAEKSGYPQMSYGAKRPFRAGSGVLLQDGQQVRDLVLTLAKGAVLTGTVYDDHGAPMSGVPVMAWEVRTALSGERTLGYAGDQAVTMITDDRGRYRVFGLPPGEYTVGTSWYYHGLGFDVRVPSDEEIRSAFQAASASATQTAGPRPTPQPEPPRHNFSPVFAPGVVDPLSATTFTLAPGEVRDGVDLRMVFEPSAAIEGTISSPNGSAVNARLTISRQGPIQALNTSQVRGATERFTAESLSPGPYVVMAEIPANGASPALWARADVIATSGQKTAVSLVLQPGLTVSGRLVFDGAELKPPADLTKTIVSLRPTAGISPQWEIKIEPDGRFTITGVIPGRYSVSSGISGQPTTGPSWSVKSVVLDGRDVTDLPFDIGAGGASGLTITLMDAISELSGMLTTPAGAPATDYFVVVLPVDRAYWAPLARRIASTRPDRAGKYLFRKLPAGEYCIAATTDLVPRDLQETNGLEQLAAVCAKVTLGVGEKKTFDLRTGR